MPEYDVNEVWQLVERVAKAGADTATDTERDMFAWLQSTLGLKRSPERYAKRTRTRYRGAARRGETAAQVNKREYQQRKTKKAVRKKAPPDISSTPHRQWIHLLDRIDVRNSYFDQSYEIDDEDLRNAILCFGYDTVLERVEQEIVSLIAYVKKHNIEPGHGYWYGNRTMQPVGTVRVDAKKSPFANEWGDLPDIDGAQIYFGNDFYFYHGTMARV